MIEFTSTGLDAAREPLWTGGARKAPVVSAGLAVMVMSTVTTFDMTTASVERWASYFPQSTSLLIGAADPRPTRSLSSVPAPQAAEQLRDLLRCLGLTKTQLKDACGVSRQTLYDWLEGRFEPEGRNAARLRQLYEIARLVPRHGWPPLRARLVTEAVAGSDSLLDLLRQPTLDMPRISEAVRVLAEHTTRLDARSARATAARHGFAQREAEAQAHCLDDNLDGLQSG